MRCHVIWGIVALTLLAGCGQKEENAKAPAPEQTKQAEPAKNGPSDFGGVTKVSREADGIGSTQELAVIAALQSAVAQVNGVRVASQLQSLRTGLDVSVNGQDAGSTRSEAFAQRLIAASQGVVQSYEIISSEEVDKVDEETTARVRASDGGYSYSAAASLEGKVSESASAPRRSFEGSASYREQASVDVKRGASSYSSDESRKKMRSYWKVRIRADIPQYRAPEEQGRPKIVVALPKTLAASYAVGDGKTSAPEVADAVRGRLSDILTQTKRFIVLDREFGSDLQAEIDHINSGNVRVQDSARIGQQLATDLILIPVIERFEYPRHVQRLRMSDRELVSYSGGGRITLRLVNATTGEVVMSDSFEHKLASADPSTMPRVVDGKNMAAEMMDALSGQIGSAIVNEIFPITVVSMTGDQVVLSQGGESLQAGQRWQAVYLGEELKDPQTGRSLGRQEAPIGTIRIDRVSTQTSYGTLEEGSAGLAGRPFQPGSIALRQKATDKGVAAITAAQDASPSKAPATAPVAVAKPKAKARAEADAAPPAPAAKDDKW